VSRILPVTLTLAEAATVLEPPMTERQLHAIVVDGLLWQPGGLRHTGRSGRPRNAYNATRLMQLHAALVPFTTIDVI
jgi:hypothetical protein